MIFTRTYCKHPGGGGGTLNSRKNWANGNITANLNVGSAQLVQDTTHSDNLAVGDDFDWQFSDMGTNYSYDFYSCDFTSTNGDCTFACATDDPVMSFNTSAYYVSYSILRVSGQSRYITIDRDKC